MSFCEKYSVLNTIMYIKYPIIILFIILLFIFMKNKNKIIKISFFTTFLIILIYYLIFLLLFITKNQNIACFYNSNPIKINLYKELTDTYKQNNININTNLNEIEPYETNKVMGGNNINIFNQLQYPLSDLKFNLMDNTKEYYFKTSGNELTILSSMLSSMNIGDSTDPISLINILKNNNVNNLNMDNLLTIFSKEFSFSYTNINPTQINDALKNNGIVLLKVHGSNTGNIFTCSDSYVLVYNMDSEEKYKVIVSDDRDYKLICNVNTKGFGNVIKSNILESSFYYNEITENTDSYYFIWR